MINQLWNNIIFRNLVFIGLFYILAWLSIRTFLRLYTNHNDKREMPQLVDLHISDAKKITKKSSFKILVEDSIFLVGREGNVILQQNPEAGATVKKNRKVYVTITKNAPDLVSVAQLPVLYGKDYERKKKELEMGFEINSEIKGYENDRGEPNQILRVFYDGEEIISGSKQKNEIQIEKGGTLEFILSKQEGASITMPDLNCKTYAEAQFILQNLNLSVDEAIVDNDVEEESAAYIYDHYPLAGEGMLSGESVRIYLSKEKPVGCE